MLRYFNGTLFVWGFLSLFLVTWQPTQAETFTKELFHDAPEAKKLFSPKVIEFLENEHKCSRDRCNKFYKDFPEPNKKKTLWVRPFVGNKKQATITWEDRNVGRKKLGNIEAYLRSIERYYHSAKNKKTYKHLKGLYAQWAYDLRSCKTPPHKNWKLMPAISNKQYKQLSRLRVANIAYYLSDYDRCRVLRYCNDTKTRMGKRPEKKFATREQLEKAKLKSLLQWRIKLCVNVYNLTKYSDSISELGLASDPWVSDLRESDLRNEYIADEMERRENQENPPLEVPKYLQGEYKNETRKLLNAKLKALSHKYTHKLKQLKKRIEDPKFRKDTRENKQKYKNDKRALENIHIAFKDAQSKSPKLFTPKLFLKEGKLTVDLEPTEKVRKQNYKTSLGIGKTRFDANGGYGRRFFFPFQAPHSRMAHFDQFITLNKVGPPMVLLRRDHSIRPDYELEVTVGTFLKDALTKGIPAAIVELAVTQALNQVGNKMEKEYGVPASLIHLLRGDASGTILSHAATQMSKAAPRRVARKLNSEVKAVVETLNKFAVNPKIIKEANKQKTFKVQPDLESRIKLGRRLEKKVSKKFAAHVLSKENWPRYKGFLQGKTNFLRLIDKLKRSHPKVHTDKGTQPTLTALSKLLDEKGVPPRVQERLLDTLPLSTAQREVVQNGTRMRLHNSASRHIVAANNRLTGKFARIPKHIHKIFKKYDMHLDDKLGTHLAEPRRLDNLTESELRTISSYFARLGKVPNNVAVRKTHPGKEGSKAKENPKHIVRAKAAPLAPGGVKSKNTKKASKAKKQGKTPAKVVSKGPNYPTKKVCGPYPHQISKLKVHLPFKNYCTGCEEDWRLRYKSVRIWVDGHKTKTRHHTRTFTSPKLDPCKLYHYNIKMVWNQHGRERVWEKAVTVRGGYTTHIHLDVNRGVLPVQVPPHPRFRTIVDPEALENKLAVAKSSKKKRTHAKSKEGPKQIIHGIAKSNQPPKKQGDVAKKSTPKNEPGSKSQGKTPEILSGKTDKELAKKKDCRTMPHAIAKLKINLPHNKSGDVYTEDPELSYKKVRIWVHGTRTQSTKAIREFTTPHKLNPCILYHYNLKIAWCDQGGHCREWTGQVNIRGGYTTELRLDRTEEVRLVQSPPLPNDFLHARSNGKYANTKYKGSTSRGRRFSLSAH